MLIIIFNFSCETKNSSLHKKYVWNEVSTGQIGKRPSLGLENYWRFKLHTSSFWSRITRRKRRVSRHVQYEVVGAASWEMRKTRDEMKTYFEEEIDKIIQFFKDRDAAKNVDLPKGDHSSRNSPQTNNHQSNYSKVEIPKDHQDYNHQKPY